MKYILEKKLLGKGSIKHANKGYEQATIPGIGRRTKYGTLLGLFNAMKDKDNIIKYLSEKYHTDMKLFGYNITYRNGKYYATCTDGYMQC